MNYKDIATAMLLSPDLLPDDDILMLLIGECEQIEEPDHYKYERFQFQELSDMQFKQYFRFHKDDITRLRKQLLLAAVYKGINGIKWSGDERLCILLRRLAYPNRLRFGPIIWKA